MPAEIRYIAFAPVDVVRAISEYQRRRRQPLPPGTVVGFDVYATPAIEASLRIVDDITGDARTVAIRAEQLAAALVLHCISQRIPIPARAQKLLFQGRDGGVVMGYAIGLDEIDRRAFAEATPPVFADPDAPAGTPPGRRAGAGEAAPAAAGDAPAASGPKPADAHSPEATAPEGTAPEVTAPDRPAPDADTTAGETERRRKAFEYQMRRAERQG